MGNSLLVLGAMMGMDVRMVGPKENLARTTRSQAIARECAEKVRRPAHRHR